MREIEIKIKLYSFHELSQEAQEKAHAEYLQSGLPVEYEKEFPDTLKAFENAFHIKVCRWWVDQNAYHFEYVKQWQWDDGDGYFNNPLRFARWLWNNWADTLKAPKIYGRLVADPATGKTLYKRWESKTTYTLDGCNFTGFCADLDITDPIRECLHYEREFCNIDQLITACLDSFFSAWRAEYEYQESIDFFKETCDANGYEFTENGEYWGCN